MSLGFNDEDLEVFLASAPEKLESVRLEMDCYSLAAARNAPIWLAGVMPLIATSSQFVVLYFLSIARGNIFQDGQWNVPFSQESSVIAIMFVSLGISVTKISTEFQHAQRLYHALLLGELGTLFKRLCCWWALLLQYAMASAVLIVSVNLVLSAQSCQGSILKTLAIFIVIDMDNLMARFVCIWIPLDFSFDIEKPAEESSAHSKSEPSASSDLRATSASHGLPGRLIFHGCPLLLLLIEIFLAVYFHTLPLTLVFYGIVSNSRAPVIPVQPVCSDVHAGRATCRVLVLAHVDTDAPRVYWIGLRGLPEPRQPTSLEVYTGRDGTNNLAQHAGSILSEAVQVQVWLRDHNFNHDVYDQLVKHNFLYRLFLPYEATFDVRGLEVYGMAFRVYVAAQNTFTKALSSSVLSSDLFFVSSHCEENCERCERYNSRICIQCVHDMHLSQAGRCEACPNHCKSCNHSSAQCDVQGCEEGFWFNETGCSECVVEHCATCIGEGQTCNACQGDYGRASNSSGDYCLECEKDCATCDVSNRDVCLECRIGYGLIESACVPCPHKCSDCMSDGTLKCKNCAAKWGLDLSNSTSPCRQCNDMDDDCTECFWDQQGSFNCTSCEVGKGMTPDGKCESCGAQCQKCDAAGFCDVCLPGYALTHTGDECKSCADNCQSCESAGPGGCDECMHGFTRSNSTWPCVPDDEEIL